jgi:hypothetical protein
MEASLQTHDEDIPQSYKDTLTSVKLGMIGPS